MTTAANASILELPLARRPGSTRAAPQRQSVPAGRRAIRPGAARWRAAARLLLIAGALASPLGGCMLSAPLSDSSGTPAFMAADAGALLRYLETMNALGSGDAARQSKIFHEVERDFSHVPNTANTLRYALARITPAHPGSDLDEGRALLESLLATPEHMTQEERTLATVLLNEANARLMLEAENRRLAATLDGQNRSQANSYRRVQAQADENLRLRRALAEAQQKLDAIKEIERSIIERSSTPTGNRDGTAHAEEAQSPPAGR